jgi:hypothetical protein
MKRVQRTFAYRGWTIQCDRSGLIWDLCPPDGFYDGGYKSREAAVQAVDQALGATADVGFYMLLKNEKVVYVGISGTPEDRVVDHWKKGWDFDDIIENSEGPYNHSTALSLGRRLIAEHRPRYNVMHNGLRGSK